MTTRHNFDVSLEFPRILMRLLVYVQDVEGEDDRTYGNSYIANGCLLNGLLHQRAV